MDAGIQFRPEYPVYTFAFKVAQFKPLSLAQFDPIYKAIEPNLLLEEMAQRSA